MKERTIRSKLTILYLEHCPYCNSAKQAIEELRAENPAYQGVDIEWVEESQEPQIANQYDYYYVPSVFMGQDKLFESSPTNNYSAVKRYIQRAMDKAVA